MVTHRHHHHYRCTFSLQRGKPTMCGCQSWRMLERIQPPRMVTSARSCSRVRGRKTKRQTSCGCGWILKRSSSSPGEGYRRALIRCSSPEIWASTLDCTDSFPRFGSFEQFISKIQRFSYAMITRSRYYILLPFRTQIRLAFRINNATIRISQLKLF